MTRVLIQAVETKGSDGEVFVRNTTASDGGYYTASSAFGGAASVSLSAGTSSAALGSVVFSNSNGVSFGLNGSTITASVSPAGGGLTNINLSAGTTSNNLSAVTFANSNGITFGLNSSTITASHNGLTSQSGQAFSAQGGSSAFETLAFANSNGVTFSNSNGSVVASYTVPSTAGLLSAVNVSAGTTSNNLSAITFANANGITFGLNASTVTASHNGLTSQSNQAVSAANGSSTFQTLSFANSNGVSFSTGTQGLFASHNGITSQSNQQLSLYAVGNTTQSSSGTQGAASLSFRGEGVASVGVTNGSVVVSVPAGGGGIQSIAAGGVTQGPSTIVFVNSNNVSFDLTNSSVRAVAEINLSAGAASGNGRSFVFSNSNGVSFGYNAGTITASHNGLTSQSNQALSAANGSFTFQTASFANSNGVSFSTGTQGIYASHNGLTSQSGQAFSASGGSSTFQTLSFTNNNYMTFSNSNGSVQGWPAIGFSAGTQSNQRADLVFSNANGVTFGLNDMTLTASVNAAGGGATVSLWPDRPFGMATSSTVANTTGLAAPTTSATIAYQVAPLVLPVAVAFNQPRMVISANTTAGTGSVSIQHAFGVYTFNAGTLSRMSTWAWNVRVSQNSVTAQTINWFYGSNSTQNSSSLSGNVSASFTGLRNIDLGSAAGTLSAGHYFIVMAHSRSSAGLNAWPHSVGFQSESQQTLGADFGTATTGRAYERFLASGTFSTSYINASEWWNAALPVSINSTALSARQGTAAQRWPIVIFNSTG